METLGPINTTGITFYSELGRRLTDVSGDPREITYLFQRVSLAVQRYNSVAFRGTFSVPNELDQCHSSLLTCFVFNPLDLYYRGIKNNNNNSSVVFLLYVMDCVKIVRQKGVPLLSKYDYCCETINNNWRRQPQNSHPSLKRNKRIETAAITDPISSSSRQLRLRIQDKKV